MYLFLFDIVQVLAESLLQTQEREHGKRHHHDADEQRTINKVKVEVFAEDIQQRHHQDYCPTDEIGGGGGYGGSDIGSEVFAGDGDEPHPEARGYAHHKAQYKKKRQGDVGLEEVDGDADAGSNAIPQQHLLPVFEYLA